MLLMQQVFYLGMTYLHIMPLFEKYTRKLQANIYRRPRGVWDERRFERHTLFISTRAAS